MKLNIEKICWVGFFFHPDLIRATSLNDKLKITVFNYEVSEALHLSDKEKIFYWMCSKFKTELEENIDVHSQYIVSTIELLLNYCSRFYGRQMITRAKQTNQ
jgi:hypothetical protein